MRPELDQKLCEKYPEIFVDRNSSINRTAMCWGFSHGDGWYEIIDALCGLIMWHCTQNLHLKPDGKPLRIPKATQVKEKYGTLSFYIDHADEPVYNFIQFAESMSARVCEECGAPAKLQGKGWYYTACEAHTKEEEK